MMPRPHYLAAWERSFRSRAVTFVAVLVLVLLWLPPFHGNVRAEAPAGTAASSNPDLFAEDNWSEAASEKVYVVSDPLEPVNRVFFTFNNKLYFWLIKPVSKGYAAVIPAPVREGIGNFFFNLQMPRRLVNSLLQGKVRRSGEELSRFVINTTIGIVGFWDPARHWFELTASNEDLGQTLGKFGFPDGIYLCWPVLGPSNLRDSLGLTGDYFLDPVNYLAINNETPEALGVKGGETVNRTSLRLGDYEALIENSFDPYSVVRDGYTQRRHSQIDNDSDE